MDKDNMEKRINEIEKRIDDLEKENDILKIELGDSIVEKYHLDEAKKIFIDRHIEQTEKMEIQISEEINQMQEYIESLKKRCKELEAENKILLSERLGGLLKEVVKQGKISKKKTGENPFELKSENNS